MSSPSQRKGALHEQAAVELLQQRGLTIITRNFYCKLGELDIIALGKRSAGLRISRATQSLHFVEVRYRATDRFGGAAASVTRAKQKKLQRTAEVFLQRHPRFRNHRAQFDVVTISGTNYPPSMVWIEAAF